MVELRWIKMSLFVILLLQFTAVTAEFSSFIVRGGDDVTLPCEHEKQDQNQCGSTNWILIGSRRQVDLVKLGQIQKSKARLVLIKNCSLVIKKVTDEDAGSYHCEQFRSEKSQVYLSVINMKEYEEDEQVTLSCSVRTPAACVHTVEWTYDGENTEGDISYSDMQISQYDCSVTASYLKQKSELFMCKVTDGYTTKKHLFPFSPQSSGEKPDEDAPPTTTIRTSERSTESRTIPTVPDVGFTSGKTQGWLFYVILAVGLVALIIITVVIIRWKRNKGNKTEKDDNTGQSLNPAETQPDQDTADPEDGVSYASVSYTKKTNSRAKVRVQTDEDEGDAVTYSTVKASSSSAGASADPSALYATVNKPNN